MVRRHHFDKKYKNSVIPRTPNTDNVICLSRFLNILLSYNVTLISHHPDTAPVLTIKFLHLDKFLTSLAACTATLRQCPQPNL